MKESKTEGEGWYMAIGIHFDTEDFDFEQDTLGIGIGHPEEKNQPLKEH